MNTHTEAIINELARRKLEGTSYSELRAGLQAEGYSPEEIGDLIRKVDGKVLAYTVSADKTDRSRQWYRAGLITAIASLGVSVAFNAGILLQGIHPLVAYAPFFAGIALMVYGKWLRRNRKPLKNQGTGSIRNKRPYK